jgi:hypothetical protein
VAALKMLADREQGNRKCSAPSDQPAAAKSLHLLERGDCGGGVITASVLQEWSLESVKKDGLRERSALCSIYPSSMKSLRVDKKRVRKILFSGIMAACFF